MINDNVETDSLLHLSQRLRERFTSLYISGQILAEIKRGYFSHGVSECLVSQPELCGDEAHTSHASARRRFDALAKAQRPATKSDP